MLDSLTLSLQGSAGMMLLVFILPLVIALGLGLLIVGLMRRRYGVAASGVLMPLAVFGVGIFMRNAALGAADAPEGLEASLDVMATFLPISLMIAGAFALIGVLPVIIKAARA